jgi:hypothetical protein
MQQQQQQQQQACLSYATEALAHLAAASFKSQVNTTRGQPVVWATMLV